jgi:hypothetical protein
MCSLVGRMLAPIGGVFFVVGSAEIRPNPEILARCLG